LPAQPNFVGFPNFDCSPIWWSNFKGTQMFDKITKVTIQKNVLGSGAPHVTFRGK
jgi:hypothetical protein